ncbi:FPG2 [Auxenochlorella protothecoides x Auxenochlorella symbiontica]
MADKGGLLEAQQALSSLISSKRRSSGENWSHAFDMMASYLQRLGLDRELHKLSVIHIAGTKGKGSTAAMVENMLRQCGYTTGLFTSPHLMDVRERIRINGELVDEATFLRNFWSAFNNFSDGSTPESPGMPAYFRFLTLLGLKIFLEQNVDVVILEVGIGGRLDATNCIRSPAVCGVSPLGFDHMDLLGHTLPEIAREKAGIFKAGRPAITVPQPADAAAALEERAAVAGASLSIAPSLDTYADGTGSPLHIGLPGAHQRVNASLAIALARAWEEQRAAASPSTPVSARIEQLARCQLPSEYLRGLATVHWPGRGQIVHDPETTEAAPDSARLSFYLDGAHTAESTAVCADWFADCAAAWKTDAATTRHILVFNCQEERSPENLLTPLARVLAQRAVPIHHAFFVPPNSSYGKLGAREGPAELTWQSRLQAVWDSLPRTRAIALTGEPGAAPPLTLGKAAAATLPSASSGKSVLPCSAVLPTLQVRVRFGRADGVRCSASSISSHFWVAVARDGHI